MRGGVNAVNVAAYGEDVEEPVEGVVEAKALPMEATVLRPANRTSGFFPRIKRALRDGFHMKREDPVDIRKTMVPSSLSGEETEIEINGTKMPATVAGVPLTPELMGIIEDQYSSRANTTGIMGYLNGDTDDDNFKLMETYMGPNLSRTHKLLLERDPKFPEKYPNLYYKTMREVNQQEYPNYYLSLLKGDLKHLTDQQLRKVNAATVNPVTRLERKLNEEFPESGGRRRRHRRRTRRLRGGSRSRRTRHR